MESVDINERKRALRARLKAVRKDLGAERRAQIDEAIQANVVALAEFAHADVVLAYLDFGPEVRTRDVIQAAWDAGKVVALPWCVPGTHEMRWFKVTSFDDLVRSKLGMDEPVPDSANVQLLTTGERMLALVPGLTFDPRGNRMGYGGGFYDTFDAVFGGVTVGLCREAQMSEDLHGEGVVDAHDLPVQIVVSESRVIRV